MMYQEEKQKLLDLIIELKNLNILNIEGGDMAQRVSDKHILVTATGLAEYRKWKATIGDIVVVDYEGKTVEKGTYPACSELPIYLHMFKQFEHCNFIVHAHEPYSQAFAVHKMVVPPILHQTYAIGEIPCVSSPDDHKEKLEYLKNPHPVNIPEAMIQRPDVYVVFEKYFPEITRLFKGREQELAGRYGLAFTIEKHGIMAFGRNDLIAVDTLMRVASSARAAILSNMVPRV